MPTLDLQVQELHDLVEEMLHQFRVVDEAAANGPHVELSVQEVRVVEYLGAKGPRMMRELAEFLLLAVNSVTSLVDNLEKKGIVTRKRSEEDRRVVRVELTRVGVQAHKAALREKRNVLRHMLAALTEEEREIFMVLFRKIPRAGWAQVRKIAASAG